MHGVFLCIGLWKDNTCFGPLNRIMHICNAAAEQLHYCPLTWQLLHCARTGQVIDCSRIGQMFCTRIKQQMDGYSATLSLVQDRTPRHSCATSSKIASAKVDKLTSTRNVCSVTIYRALSVDGSAVRLGCAFILYIMFSWISGARLDVIYEIIDWYDTLLWGNYWRIKTMRNSNNTYTTLVWCASQ